MLCDHCERDFDPKSLHPVIVSGAQSYNGHLLTGRAEERRANLCSTCYANLKNTGVQGLTVEDDEDALAQRAAGEVVAPVDALDPPDVDAGTDPSSA